MQPCGGEEWTFFFSTGQVQTGGSLRKSPMTLWLHKDATNATDV